jgi:ankyrin repeat protein
MTHEADSLISKGMYVISRCLRGKTPLIHAAKKGHTTVLKLHLDKGADMRERSGNSGTALTWAASNGHVETVVYLLDEGMEIDACDEDKMSNFNATRSN